MAKKTAELILKVKQTGAKALDKVRGGIKAIGAAAAIAGVAVAAFVGKSIAAYKVQEQAINSLNTSLAQQGIFTEKLSKQYQETATALQKVTTFGDEAIISAQGQLTAYLGQTEVTEDLLKATLDFASGMKVDLKTAADLVGKSIGSSTNALSRYGIAVDTSMTKSEKLAAVTEAMNSRFGGQAEAAAMGVGALDQMSNSLGDVMEVVGQAFAPMITAAAKAIRNFADDIQSNEAALASLTAIASFISKTFAGVKAQVIALGGAIGVGLAASIETVSLLMQGEFTKAKEVAALGVAEVGRVMTDAKATLYEEINAIDAQQDEHEANRAAQAALNVKTSILRNAQIKKKEDATKITEEQKYQAALLGIEIKAGMTRAKLQAALDKAKASAQASTFATIATLQSSGNRTLATIGKAAALTQIAIAAPEGVSKALAAFPPPFNFAAAAAVGAAFAAQAAQVAGIPMADGGIVQSSRGGTPAIIGEAGRDEAVIPLPDDFDPDSGGGIGGGGITIIVNGGLLGDPASAREFALAVDEQLTELRRNNESNAFDEDLI